jgi:hypothetical protein
VILKRNNEKQDFSFFSPILPIVFCTKSFAIDSFVELWVLRFCFTMLSFGFDICWPKVMFVLDHGTSPSIVLNNFKEVDIDTQFEFTMMAFCGIGLNT